MTSNHLFFSCLVLIGVALSNSCNQDKPNPMSKQDSVNVQVAVRLDKVMRRIDSLEDRYNQDLYSTYTDLDTLYRMAYRGQNKAEDLGKWQRRGERVKAFRKGFLGI